MHAISTGNRGVVALARSVCPPDFANLVDPSRNAGLVGDKLRAHVDCDYYTPALIASRAGWSRRVASRFPGLLHPFALLPHGLIV